jgi:hypothetical protein
MHARYRRESLVSFLWEIYWKNVPARVPLCDWKISCEGHVVGPSNFDIIFLDFAFTTGSRSYGTCDARAGARFLTCTPWVGSFLWWERGIFCRNGRVRVKSYVVGSSYQCLRRVYANIQRNDRWARPDDVKPFYIFIAVVLHHQLLQCHLGPSTIVEKSRQ